MEKLKSKKIKKHIKGVILDAIVKYPKTLVYGLKIIMVVLNIIAYGNATLKRNQKCTHIKKTKKNNSRSIK